MNFPSVNTRNHSPLKQLWLPFNTNYKPDVNRIPNHLYFNFFICSTAQLLGTDANWF